MKYSEDQIVSQITSNLSIDSSMAAKQSAGAAYANWFYAHNNHGVENQRICISKIASVLGLDFDTALRIQAPILSAYSAAYVIGIANDVIFSQHAQVSRQISNHLVDKAVQQAQQAHAAQAQAAQVAQRAQAAKAAQVALTPKEAYEAKVEIENYQKKAGEKIVTVPRDQAIQPRLTVQEAQKSLASAREKLQAAYQEKVVQDELAKKHREPGPNKWPAWELMNEQHKGLVTRNYATILKNQTIVANNIILYEKLQAYNVRLLQLAQEDAEVTIAAGTVTFKRSDIAKAARSIEVGEKFQAFYVSTISEFNSLQQSGMVVSATSSLRKWEYTMKARQQFKVDVERYVENAEYRLAHEGPAIKAIQSFATGEKQWVLLNKPAPQSEFDFFYSNLCWFPRVDFATITKLNLSNSGIGDDNAYTLTNSILTVLPNLKILDVSDNPITPTGEGFFAKALQNETD